MRKRWWLGGLIGVALLAGGGAWMANKSARAGKAPPPPEKPLAFTPREVALPQRIALAGQVNFSGPLVAPHTATVRSRAAPWLLVGSAVESTKLRTSPNGSTPGGGGMAGVVALPCSIGLTGSGSA